MKNIYSRLVLILFLALFLFVGDSFARENVIDWYIQDFKSEIVVNKDSSLDITETITADCGSGIDKHGIFRILPEEVNIDGIGTSKTPVELVSIKDLEGSKYNYSESKNISDKTVTWKIGDADKTVQGVNVYVIKYKVKNAVRSFSSDFDELYWNLTGNFWDLEIDKANIKIIFPAEINKDNATVDLYAGSLGYKGSSIAQYDWRGKNILEISSSQTLPMRNGITVAVTFPKNIIAPYQPSFWELYGNYLFLLIPILVFVICFRIWKKYGDDPEFSRTVIAEYEAPKDMSPIEIGLLMTNGNLKDEFITAEIINFATNGIITIKEIENKILVFTSKDHEFTRTNNAEAESKLNLVQKNILSKIFEKGDVIKLSSLKNNFYKILKDVKKDGNELLSSKKLIVATGLKYSAIFIPIGIVLTIWGTMFSASVSGWLSLAVALSGVTILIFGFIMPKRTFEGAQMNWKIKGFKLFMETVDKDRAKFYEKENIFEKLLPHAILFGITSIWIKRIKEIYGEEYFASHVPAWYVGSNLSSFDANSFASTIDGLSKSISASTSAPSGSGGAGGAGGGGGGGGGGGW